MQPEKNLREGELFNLPCIGAGSRGAEGQLSPLKFFLLPLDHLCPSWHLDLI